MMDCATHFHAYAIHAEHGYRSFTPGIGALCRSGERLLGSGIYKNSIGKDSAYLAAGWQPFEAYSAKLGIVGGFVTGYRASAVPMAAALVSYRDVHLTVIPPFKGKTPLTVGISWEWR